MPSGYLAWVVDEWDDPATVRAAKAELLRRLGAAPSGSTGTSRPTPPTRLSPGAREILTAGFRTLARQRHPDTGGTTRAMQALNAAYAELRRFFGEET